MPQFNINGKTEIPTLVGAITSIIIIILTLLFGMIKLEHLVQRKNPTINIHSEVLEEGTSQSMEADNLMIAFALERANSNTDLDDNRFFKWYALDWNANEGVFDNKFFEMHQCTHKDLKKFYP